MGTTRDITGLVLAGGAGRRVGGHDKGLLEWRGKPLAAHVAGRLRPQVNRLLISCNRNAQFYRTLADATVRDTRRDYQGPLAGLEAAMPHLGGEFLVIAPCDMPLLPLNLARGLLAALDPAGATGPDIAYANDGERDQYLCAAIRVGILPSLGEFLDEGQRAVRHWYARHRCVVVDFSAQAECFANYNSLE